MAESKIRMINAGKDSEHEKAVQELQRLLACYQIASIDDKRVVWAVLNKYMKHIAL
jgi:hypothetical protein